LWIEEGHYKNREMEGVIALREELLGRVKSGETKETVGLKRPFRRPE
jgi:hypothetical protein